MLCTCEGEELTDPDWVLERRDESIPEQHRRGRAAIPRYSESEAACLDEVISKLDDGACFDFDYAPQPGDVLMLRWERESVRWVRFRFESGGWTVDQSTALTGWRSQMVVAERGRRGHPKESPSRSR